MRVDILTLADAARLADWTRRAVNSEISLTMSHGHYRDEGTVEATSWGGFRLMDQYNMAMTKVAFDRDGTITATISHFCLPVSVGVEFQKITAAHIRRCFGILQSMGVEWVAATVAADNPASLNLCNKIFGKPWGVCPQNAWSGALREYVDSYHYRRKLVFLMHTSDRRVKNSINAA